MDKDCGGDYPTTKTAETKTKYCYMLAEGPQAELLCERSLSREIDIGSVM